MKRLLLVLLVFLVAGTGAGVAYHRRVRRAAPVEPVMADWQSFRYERLPQKCARKFDLRFHLGGDWARGRARVLLNVQGPASAGAPASDYYFVEFGDAITIGRVTGGIETLVGTRPRGNRSARPVLNRTDVFVIERRPLSISVVADGRVVATAYDASLTGGRMAFGSPAGAMQMQKVRYQPVDDLYFADDFMRAAADKSTWTTRCGTWNTVGVRNRDDEYTLEQPVISLSSNYFRFNGRGSPFAAVTTGHWFWDDYLLEVACRPKSTTAAGIYFCFREDARAESARKAKAAAPETPPAGAPAAAAPRGLGRASYFLVRWGGAKSDRAGVELIRCERGHSTVVAQRPGGHHPNQWYQLNVLVHGDWARVAIDDTPVFTVRDPLISHGQIGLYAEGTAGADFDDLLVRSVPAFFDDFADQAPGKWTPIRGDWLRIVHGAPWSRHVRDRFVWTRADGEAMLLCGDERWRDYAVAATFGPWGAGAVGLCAHYQDEANYYFLRLGRGSPMQASLCKTFQGEQSVLASRTLPAFRSEERHRASLRVRDGHITVSLDGRPTLETWDTDLAAGRGGLLVDRTDGARFDSLDITMTRDKAPIMSQHEAFSHEKSMSIWADALSDWRCLDSFGQPVDLTEESSGVVVPEAGVTWWHCAPLRGDVTLAMKLPPRSHEAGPSRHPWFITLTAGAEREDKAAGYALTCRFVPAADDTAAAYHMTLRRLGKEVAQAERPGHVEWHTLRLRRMGPFVLGYLGDQRVLQFKDESPLAGVHAGWRAAGMARARGVRLSPSDFVIYSDNVRDYTFRRAPTDWRIAAGQWDVANRWQCDPRWSFFSGRSNGLAAIWNKRPCEGDVSVEFYVGTMMDRSRGRGYQDYAADYNATICADGSDLASGYSFVFGGDQNSVTRIYRGRTVLAETRGHLIETRGLHRRWYHVRVSKTGRRLAMHIDGQPALACEDPDPLPGKYVAIWTHDNGIMVARVRVSASRLLDREPPDRPYPADCASIYTRK